MPYQVQQSHNVFRGPICEFSYPLKTLLYLNDYDGEIHYVDSELAELIEFLKNAGLYDNALIIITADHGEQFGEHGTIWHGFSVHNEEVHVPLILKVNNLSLSVSDTVSTIDIYPTIFDILNITLNHTTQGISLMEIDKADGPHDVLSESTAKIPYKSITTKDGKRLILAFNASSNSPVNKNDEILQTLYDTQTDPREMSVIDDKDLSESLNVRFYLIYNKSLEYREKINLTLTKLTPETIDDLKALGYLN